MSVKCNDNLLEKIELPSKEMEYLNCENNCLSSLEMEDTTIVCEDEDSSEQGLIAGEQHVSVEAEQIDDSKWKLELASALNIHNMDKVVNVQFSSEMQDAFLEDGSIIFGTDLDSKPSFSYEYPVEIGDAVENMKVIVQVEFPKNGDSEGFSDSDGNMAEEPLSGELGEGQMIQEDVLAGVNEQDAESDTAAPTSGTCGDNLKWELDNGTLTIDGTGEMYDYHSPDSAPWHNDINNIKKVVIKQGVTSIGGDAFYGCSSLTSITIPSSVTSIGWWTFGHCGNLTSVTIPSGVTRIQNHAFCECRSLTSITIPSGVTSIEDSAFSGCSSLKSITIPSGVTRIQKYAFSGCSSLTSITIPSGVTRIGDSAFSGCSSLTSITIPSGVTSIEDGVFFGCSSLTSITIPSGVTSIGGDAFYECSSLKSITIPNSVTSIGIDAFLGCSSLTSITIPSGVTCIGRSVFYECSSLTSITIPSGVTHIVESAFYECSSLTSITIPSSVTGIGNYAFYGCSSLTSITIPSGVTSIEKGVFNGCSSLTSITIPSGVTSIECDAFYRCSSLADVYYEGSEAEWKNIYIDSYNTSLTEAKIHYNSSMPSFDKNFSLKVSNGGTVFGKENALFVDYEASVSGEADSEGKQIKWESSNPSVAEIDQKNAGLIVSQDGNSGSGWINLLTYDVGRTVISGTSVDGRKTSVAVEVEPELSPVNNSINISKETLVPLCSVKLEKANKEYLESFMKGLSVASEGAVTVRNTRYAISEDGKSAEFSAYVDLIGTEEGYVICTSKGGQTVKVPVGEPISSVDSLIVKAAFGDKSYKKDLHWTKDGYNEGELEVSIQICDPSNSVHLDEINVELKNLKMFKVKDASKVTNIGSDYTYCLNMDQGIDVGQTITVKLTLTKKGLTWWKPDDGNVHSGEIIVNINGADEKGSIVSGCSSLDVSYQNELKKVGAGDEEKAEKKAQKDADKSLTETVDAFVDLSDKMVLDPNIETYLGHNQFEALKLLIYSEIAMANISKEYFTSSGLSDEVAEKIMEKFLGYEKPKFGIADKRVPIEVVVQGLNDQLYQFSFDCDVSVYSYDGNPYGINGTIVTKMWRVSELNQKQEEIRCSTGLINEADLEQFTQSLWNAAESSIKSAYMEIWGNDANKVANEIVEGCIDSIASKAAKYGLEKPIQMVLEKFYKIKLKDQFSQKFFDLLIYPSKKGMAGCPVDVYVYNSSNVLVGSIISDEVSILGVGVALWTVGDDKYFQLFDDTYRLVYKATGTGTMNISIYDQMANNYNYRSCEFIQIPLNPNVEYTQSINNEFMTSVENYKVTSNQGEVINASKVQDLYETITIPENPTPAPTVPPVPTVEPTPAPTATPTPTPESHIWGAWKTVQEADVFHPELQERSCVSCGEKEQKVAGDKLSPVLELNAAAVTLKGKQATTGLKITRIQKGDSVVSWKSSNIKIVKVSSKGKLTAQKKTGKATVTVTLKSGISKKITVKVQKKAVATTKFTGLTKKVTLKKGKSIALKPIRQPFTSIEKITYSSSRKEVATVTSKGRVKAVSKGKCRITVKAGKKKAYVTVTVR